MNHNERINDELLVIQAQEGSLEAMGRLIERWQDRLWRLAWRLTDDEQAATLHDGIWVYETDILYSSARNQLKVTVSLPTGAKVRSVQPAPAIQFDEEGRTVLRFQASRGKDETDRSGTGPFFGVKTHFAS